MNKPQPVSRQSSFPLTAKYDPRWIRENALGEDALCQAEILARHIPFRTEMRVLELGCGKASSAIFLAREFGVQVWAGDSTTSASDNYQRATGMQCDKLVLPMRIDADSLPFAHKFFDAVIAIDAYLYFGTDERYLPYVSRFIKPGGSIGIVDIAFKREMGAVDDAPAWLLADYERFWSSIHTADWWRRHWQKTGLVAVTNCDFVAESDWLLENYGQARAQQQSKDPIASAILQGGGEHVGLFCLVATIL